MFEFIVVLVIVLGAVTVVGHGIWVLLAKLVSAGRGPHQKHCPVCRTILQFQDLFCDKCGWTAGWVNSDRFVTLENVRQILWTLKKKETIDTGTYAAFLAIIEEQRRRWLQGAPEAPPVIADPVPLLQADAPAADLAAQELSPHPDEPITASVISAAGSDSLEDRLARFHSQRSETPLVDSVPLNSLPLSGVQKEPSRSWSQLLSAFMEERHIRWGELVGGLLIVFCSTALVISFWADIAERPFLKFFVFNGVTAALFGVGLYADHRWKLATTSHGVLLIAALLVPLNFLAIAAFSIGQAPLNLVTLGGEIFSVALFAALLFFTARILLPEAPILLTASVIVPSVLTLVIRRHITPETSSWVIFTVLGVLAASYAILNQLLLIRSHAQSSLAPRSALALLTLLGISSFATALPIALLIHKSGDYAAMLHELSPSVAAFGLPALALGVTFWRKLVLPDQSLLRTIGTSTAVFGILIMLLGIGLAWPDPKYLLPCAILNAALLVIVAVIYSLPQLHLLSTPCLSLSLLIGWLLVRGHLQWEMEPRAMSAALLSANAAVAMTGIAAILGALAGALSTVLDRRHALWHLPIVLLLSVCSVVLITLHGFARVADAQAAVWIYTLYALVAFILAVRLRYAVFTWISSLLLLMALMQAAVFAYASNLQLVYPWLTALLVHSSVMAVVVVVDVIIQTRRSGQQSVNVLRLPCTFAALITSICALSLTAWLIVIPGIAPVVALQSFATLSVIWMSLALVWRHQPLAVASQLALTLALLFGVATGLEGQKWVTGSLSLWLDPRSVQAHGIAFVGVAFLWFLVRHGSRRVQRLQSLHELIIPGITLDRGLIAAALVLLTMLAAYGAAPGAILELSPVAVRPDGTLYRSLPPIEQFEFTGIPHSPALGPGSWLLMGSTLLILLLSLRDRHQLWTLLGLLISLSTIVPLIAGRFESEAAVASALRWLSSGYLLLGSIAVWSRHLWLGRLKLFALTDARPNVLDAGSLRVPVVTGIFVLALAPLVAMAAYVAIAALIRVPPARESVSRLLLFAMIFGGVLVVALVTQMSTNRRANAAAYFARYASLLLLLIAAAPLISVSLYVLAAALQQRPVHGPDPSSIFAQMGTAASYSIPIVLTALVLTGYAIRERDASFAFAGGLLWAVAATAAYLLSITKAGAGLNAEQWVRLTQLNAAVAALYGIAWTGSVWSSNVWSAARLARSQLQESRIAASPQKFAIHPLLTTFVALPLAFHIILLVTATATLLLAPTVISFQYFAGDWRGWISLLLTLLSGGAVIVMRRHGQQQSISIRERFLQSISPIAVTLTLIGLMIVCTVTRWDTGNWLSYHWLLVVMIAAASALPALFGAVRLFEVKRGPFLLTNEVVGWSFSLGLISFVVAVRSLAGDPQAPWWTVGGAGSLAVLSVALACGSAIVPRVFMVVSALLVNFAAILTWLDVGTQLDVIRFVQLNVLAFCLPAPLWVLMECRVLRPRLVGVPRWSLHGFAAWLGAAFLLIIACMGLAADYVGSPLSTQSILGVLGLVATIVAFAACMWDAYMRSTLCGWYLLGLVACAMMVDALDIPSEWLVWTGSIVLASYGLATSYLWSIRQGLTRSAASLGIPISDRLLSAHRWILPANCLLVMAVVGLGLRVQITIPDLSMRILSSQAILAQALAIGLLARGERRTQLQYAALVVGALGAIAFSWSWLDPATTRSALPYAVNALAALVAMMAIYGLALNKITRHTNEWTDAAQRLVPALAAIGIADVVLILVREVSSYAATGTVPLGWATVTTVSISLSGIVASCLASALMPGRDPLNLSDRYRTIYVYVAELVVAMLLVHLRVSMPWLFRGWFTQYWPVVIILVAFLGVALSELFRRQRRAVLAEPLEHTGAFLPLLPILGFWIFPSTVHFSLLMLAVGGVYSALATLRKSFLFGILAALSGNVGLWYFLHHTGVTGLLQHPQLWLIPPSICVLVGAYMNKDRLTEAQMTSLRYAAAAGIYVSSTADIFLNGVAHAPWLPLVLGALSIAGIFVGFMLRIRGFLFLGTSFLLLSLFTIVWYAAVDLRMTWIWAASGIITGALIIALFAVFEKKRQEVLQLVEHLKEWHK